MTIDNPKLDEIAAMLREDILTNTDLATRLHEAGMPELACVRAIHAAMTVAVARPRACGRGPASSSTAVP